MPKAPLILCSLFLALAPRAGASCQVVLGHLVDDSWRAPLPDAQITIQTENGNFWGAISNSAGLFRFDSVPPGDYRLRIENLCFRPLDRDLPVPPESRIVDLGTVDVEHARPRLRLDHDMCQATREEDSETRLLLETVASDSTWLAFAERHPDTQAPVSSFWLRWGSSISLFGRERDVLSPLQTGTSGLPTAANRQTYKGPFFVVSLRPARETTVLSVIAATNPGSFSESLVATFQRSVGGWALMGVMNLESRRDGGIEKGPGGRREAGIP
jgi:hypothetical protein